MMRPLKIQTVLFVLLLMGGLSPWGFAQGYEPNWASLDQRPLPAWYDEAKFGIFIHWGVYSVPAFAPTDGDDGHGQYAEWYWQRYREQREAGEGPFLEFHRSVYGDGVRYQDFAPLFRAELFDPAQWATLFKQAGARYVVLTSKHHDGFTLWPSEQSWNWNALDVGPHRDLAGDLSAAVKDAGLHMGFYYSLYEWYNPLYHADVNRYVGEHMLPQLKDLVTWYEPEVVWSDGEWDHPSSTWQSESFLAWLYNESPVRETVVVNDRWGAETRSTHGGFYTTEYGLAGNNRGLSRNAASHKWEETRGIGGSFGYNRMETLDDYSTARDLVHLLIDVVSKGGNLLLNIGPTADGRIPVIMQQRLAEIGAWLDANGEAIYETRPWTVHAEGDVHYTAKEDAVYAISLAWPGQTLELDYAPELIRNARVTLIGYDQPLAWRQRRGRLSIELPELSFDIIETLGPYAYVFKLEGLEPPEER